MRNRRGLLEVLNKDNGLFALERADHPANVTLLQRLRQRMSPVRFRLLIRRFLQSRSTITLHDMLYANGKPRSRWPEFAASVSKLKAAGPSILLERSAWSGPKSSELNTLAKLIVHNRGLLCRGASDEQIDGLSLITDVLGISMKQHAEQLFALRTSEPLLYEAALDAPARVATAMAKQGPAVLINRQIVARQILLNRTLHFQRAVAFTHRYGQSPISQLFPFLNLNRKPKVGAGLAWLEALNTAAGRSLRGLHLVGQEPGQPIKIRGAKKRPERWVETIVEAFWKKTSDADRLAYQTVVVAEVPKVELAREILWEILMTFKERNYAYTQALLSEAGLQPLASVERLDVFTHWAAGLTERAFLTVFAVRLLQAAEETAAVLANIAADVGEFSARTSLESVTRGLGHDRRDRTAALIAAMQSAVLDLPCCAVENREADKRATAFFANIFSYQRNGGKDIAEHREVRLRQIFSSFDPLWQPA